MNLEIGYDLNTLLGSVALDYKLTFGDDVDGDTPMYWGDVASGTTEIQVYVQNGSAKLTERGQFYFNTMRADTVVFSSEHVTWTGTQKHATLSFNGQFDFGGNNFVCNQENVNDSSVLYTSSDVPTYNPFYNKNYSERRIGKIIKIDYTTSNQVHNRLPDVPYMPISGGEYTYNQIRNYVVNEYNNANPEETISVNDLPDIDGNLPTEETTEATEPPYDVQPFSIDYDEILGEKELESILKETQYVLDTAPAESIDFSFPETLPEVSAPDTNIVSAVGKVFEMHKNIVPPELVTIWGGLAVFAVLFWWLTK